MQRRERIRYIRGQMLGKYDHLNREDLVRLLEARESRQRFGLVWEANESERVAAAARKKVAAHYSWDAVAAQYLTLYARAMP